ncbi:agmatinase [Oceaniserpentilla sp. 4NH20-0058]|uniref:agmatinase n=1 Tax=Oceaniserpentilla sp. 4NH20-0058 TaxID=3127660 RepID=UPI0031030F4F
MSHLKANADYPIYGALGNTFMEFPFTPDFAQTDADVVVTGVPFDMATSGRAGARLGPQGVRAASINMAWECERWPWDFALDEHLKVIDSGNVVFKHGEPQTLVDALEAQILNIVQGDKIPLTIGGDHFITLPILRSVAKQHGPVALIHFDAHTDTYSGGSKYDHGTFLYHAVKQGIVDTSHSLQIGIRTNYTRENYPFEVLDAAWVGDKGPKETLKRIKQRVGNQKVYVTFDIDCLDPAYAPGTGTPVAAGLTSDYAFKIVRGLQGLNLIGMDVVEVSPAYDHAEITSLAAATVALDLLYVLAANKQEKISL